MFWGRFGAPFFLGESMTFEDRIAATTARVFAQLGEPATYQHGVDAPIACTAIVDGTTGAGDGFPQVTENLFTVSLLLSELTPRKEALVTTTGGTYRIKAKLSYDRHAERWTAVKA